MNTELQQTLTLVIAANAKIAGERTPRFAVGEGMFKFWEFYRFVEQTKGLFGTKEHLLAADPEAWLDQVAAEAKAVRVFTVTRDNPMISDRMASGFAGGGARWIMEVEGSAGCDLWEPLIELGDRGRRDQRIWRSRVWRVARGQSRQDIAAFSLEGATRELAEALEGTRAFAEKHGIGNFASIFRDALDQLHGRPHPATRALFEGLDLPMPALRLLEASGTAHVFGGMGSWNDLGFDGEDDRLYQDVSNRLYEAIQAALPAAANATARTA